MLQQTSLVSKKKPPHFCCLTIGDTQSDYSQNLHSIEYDSEGTRRLANKNKKDRKQREKRCKSH